MENVSPPPRARTKIIATVGPACVRAEQLAELVRAGVSVFRLNMAHAGIQEHGRTLEVIRETGRRLREPVAVLVDLAGPKIRLGELSGDAIECPLDAEFRFVRGDKTSSPDELVTSYPALVDELETGNTIMLADGTVGMKVIEKSADSARARVVQPGTIRSRQGLNLPGVKLRAPALNDADRQSALWAADNEIDFIGLSFVRRASDVVELKKLLRARGSAARVVAKIEKPEAVENLESIVAAADCLMVARGDLGVEIDVARMPLVQKQIAASCRRHQKPVIIATQMLDSMQHSRLPTRAEATDVANAILDGGDACMLSAETAIGRYPLEAVKMMNRIALATEEWFRDGVPQPPGELHPEGLHPVTAAIVYGAGHIAAELEAKLIVVASHSGATALALSKQRNYVPTAGISDDPRALGQMCLYWGVIPLIDVPAADSDTIRAAIARWGVDRGILASGDYVVLIAGRGLDAGPHNEVMVHRVG